MKLFPLENGSSRTCYYCGHKAKYISLFFARPLCSQACAQLLYLEWYEKQRIGEDFYMIGEKRQLL